MDKLVNAIIILIILFLAWHNGIIYLEVNWLALKASYVLILERFAEHLLIGYILHVLLGKVGSFFGK